MQVLKDMAENYQNSIVSKDGIVHSIQLFWKCSVQTVRQSHKQIEKHLSKEDKTEEQQVNRKMRQKGGHMIFELTGGEAEGGTGKEPLSH